MNIKFHLPKPKSTADLAHAQVEADKNAYLRGELAKEKAKSGDSNSVSEMQARFTATKTIQLNAVLLHIIKTDIIKQKIFNELVSEENKGNSPEEVVKNFFSNQKNLSDVSDILDQKIQSFEHITENRGYDQKLNLLNKRQRNVLRDLLAEREGLLRTISHVKEKWSSNEPKKDNQSVLSEMIECKIAEFKATPDFEKKVEGWISWYLENDYKKEMQERNLPLPNHADNYSEIEKAVSKELVKIEKTQKPKI